MVYNEINNKKSMKVYPKFLHSNLYGVRSNISDSTIRNNNYNNIISLFVGNTTKGVEHVEFRNPSFFNTRKELLSRAWFQIIDLNTNLPPNF